MRFLKIILSLVPNYINEKLPYRNKYNRKFIVFKQIRVIVGRVTLLVLLSCAIIFILNFNEGEYGVTLLGNIYTIFSDFKKPLVIGPAPFGAKYEAWNYICNCAFNEETELNRENYDALSDIGFARPILDEDGKKKVFITLGDLMVWCKDFKIWKKNQQ